MTTTPADLDALTALEKGATPAPWKADTETRGDCVLWGPDGQFVANAQAEPHWLPAADGGKRAVMFDVDRRDVALIAAMRNALPALLDELAKLRADVQWHHETLPKVTDQRNAASVQAEQWEKRYAEMLNQRDTAIQQHAAAREELEGLRGDLNDVMAQRDEALTDGTNLIIERDPARKELAKVRAELDEANEAYAAQETDLNESIAATKAVLAQLAEAKTLLAEYVDGEYPHRRAKQLLAANPATTAEHADEHADEPAANVHGYTAHGHPCCGEATVGSRPTSRARCGGVHLCRDCQAAAGRIHAAAPAAS